MSTVDMHLSEVHVRAAPVEQGGEGLTTEFAFRGSRDLDEVPPACMDADGDMDVVRPSKKRARNGSTHASAGGVLRIQHALATPLSTVGLQVWRGALLLSEWLLSQVELVHDRTLMDLGAGCGLTSLVASVIGARALTADGRAD